MVRHTLLALLLILSLAPVLPVSAQEGEGVPTIVAMHGSEFDPDAIYIEVNGTVSWVNQDSFAHDVTVIDNGDFNSTGGPGGMAQGATYQYKFEEPGVYDYYCTVHSTGRGNGMWGRVIVVDEMIPLAGAGGEENPEHIGVRWLAHWVGIISFLAVFAVLIIYYFVLKYGETVHATDHRDRKEK